MYIPNPFALTDESSMLSFMQSYPFVTMVNNTAQSPVGMHLPVVVSRSHTGEWVIKGHVAKANPQWSFFASGTETLIIFQEPHAYISPSLYAKKENVPTWNYMAVHVYGVPTVIEEEPLVIGLLEQMITTFELGYMQQWQELSAEYKTGMIKGIVAFEMIVTRTEAKAKLSQNKTTAEQERIKASLSDSDRTEEKELALWMGKP